MEKSQFILGALICRIAQSQQLHQAVLTGNGAEMLFAGTEAYPQVTVKDTTDAMTAMSELGLCEKYEFPSTRPRFRMNGDKILEYYQARVSRKDDPVHLYAVLGDEWLAEILTGFRVRRSEPNKRRDEKESREDEAKQEDFVVDAIPASDRIVTLNHNSSELREMIVTIDDAIRELDGINDRSAIDSETLQEIFALKAGRIYLEAPQVDLSVVERTLVAALKALTVRAFNVSVDAAITAALAAVLLFFGLT